MPSLSASEKRLGLILAMLGFLILNYLGYQKLISWRAKSLAAQNRDRAEIKRLTILQEDLPAAEVTREWITQKLPVYTSEDVRDTKLYQDVRRLAEQENIELNKNDTRPFTRDAGIDKSVVDIEFTDEIGRIISFFHKAQDTQLFRNVSRLEFVAAKDPKDIRVQARIEQWWSPESENYLAASDAAGSAPPASNSPAAPPPSAPPASTPAAAPEAPGSIPTPSPTPQ
jgi:hypothetical protein